MNESITSWSSNSSHIYPAYFNSLVARADSLDRQIQQETRERKYQGMLKNEEKIREIIKPNNKAQIEYFKKNIDQTMGAHDKLSRLGLKEAQDISHEYSIKVTDASLTYELQKSLSKVNNDIKEIVKLQIGNPTIRNLSSLKSVINEAQNDIRLEKKSLFLKSEKTSESLKKYARQIYLPQSSVEPPEPDVAKSPKKIQTKKNTMRTSQKTTTMRTSQKTTIKGGNLSDRQSELNSSMSGSLELLSERNSPKRMSWKQTFISTKRKSLRHHKLPVGVNQIYGLHPDKNETSQNQDLRPQSKENLRKFSKNLYNQNKEFLTPFKLLVKEELQGGITQGETVQLHNSLGVLTLYQGLRLTSQVNKFEYNKDQFYAVPQKSLIKKNIIDSLRKQNDVGHKFAGDVLLELDGLSKFKEYMDHKEF